MDHPILHAPWRYAAEPFEIADRVFYVGNTWVGSYLLDTGDGLILIDSGVAQSVYLLLENIRKLGFDPRQIKKILLTHGHFDHAGGAEMIRRYTGAQVYLGREDWFIVDERPELLLAGQDACPLFERDAWYREGEPIRLGNVSIQPVHTPGHTPGTWSFFFQTTWQGGVYMCGMHGGLGFNTLHDAYFEQTGLPRSLREEYLRSLEKLRGIHVDIHLGSHPETARMLEKAAGRKADQNPFIDPEEWNRFLDAKRRQFLDTFADAAHDETKERNL